MAEKERKKRGKAWSEVNPSSGRSGRFDDGYDKFELTDSPALVRLVGDLYEILIHWVPTKSEKGESSYPALCRKNDGPEEDCPMCKAGIRQDARYLTNAIIRDIQADEPRKPGKPDKGAKYRKKGDRWWSPIRVLSFPGTPVGKIKKLSDMNKVELKKNGKKTGQFKSFGMEHPKYGRDLNISLDKSQSGGSMYDVIREDRTPLEESEQAYLLYDLESAYNYIPGTEEMLKDLVKSYERGALNKSNSNLAALRKLLKNQIMEEEDEEDEEDDYGDEEDYGKSKSKSKKNKSKNKNKKSRKDLYEEDDLDDEDDDIEDDEDDDLDDEPKKKTKKSKGKKPKNKKGREDDDDDEDDELDEDDDDEDEEDDEPKKKSKKGKNKKSKDEEDEDDEDEDLDDDDDDDLDEDDDDLDEDDDDLDEDEDDEPKKKSKNKKGRKNEEDEDDEDEDEDDELDDEDDLDDDDDDDDLDEDEDDEPKKKSKKGKSKKSKDEDEEDDEPKKSKKSKEKKRAGKKRKKK